MKQFSWMVLLAALFCWGCQEKELASADLPEDASYEGPLWMIKGVGGGPLTRAVGEKDKFWSAGDTVRIKFLNGSADWQGKVKQYAALWLEHANLRFEYVAAAELADVKIGFDTDEKYVSWSVIGTDCRLVPQDEVSLNFYGFSYETEAGIKAEVLRGIGHVLGLGFEHKNPGCPMEFADELDVADEYGLTEAEVRQLIDTYNTEQINGTEYDPASIMVISVPRILLTRPTRPYATSRNMELSALDKSFIGEVYPLGDSAIVVMKTAKPAVKFAAMFSEDMEVDWGDGTRKTYSLTNPGPDTNGFIWMEHTYADSVEHCIKIYGDGSTLTYLNVSFCQLTYLNVDGCIAMKVLFMTDNQISTIDLSKNKALESLECFDNVLMTLDISKNYALVRLSCDDNLLSSLDVSNNLSLKYLLFGNNKLTDIDVSKNTLLEGFFGDKNLLTHLDLSENHRLKSIGITDNYIEKLTLGKKDSLEMLFCWNNRLTFLDVSQYYELTSLSCSNNPIEVLSLNGNPKLEFLDCDHCSLTSLDLTNNLLVYRVNCENNQIKTLTLAKSSQLNYLNCSNNNLISLDMSNSSGILTIECRNNPFIYDHVQLINFVSSLREQLYDGYLFIDEAVVPQIESICTEKNWRLNPVFEY